MRKTILSLVAVMALVIGAFVVSGYAAGTLSAKDQKMAKKAAMGGIAEVEMGQMAQQMGTSQEVKDFGSRMVTDHGKANDELKTLAQQKNLTLPTETDKTHKAMADKLKKLSGEKFDKAYMKDMVKDHKKDVAEFKKAEKSVKDPDLKAWFQKTTPVIEEHLKMAQDIEKKLK